MPATIVPINLTRSYSLRNPDGLRYGNFEGMVHLPPLTRSSKPIEQVNFSKFNNEQIYRTICEWFESWRAWQQRTLLYGIVDRCNTRQLDILSTTLEPVRHRDYAAAYKMRYPSSPFKRSTSKVDSMHSRISGSTNLARIAEPSGLDDSSDITSVDETSMVKHQTLAEVPTLDLRLSEFGDTDSSIMDETTSQGGSSATHSMRRGSGRNIHKEDSGDIGTLAVIEEKVMFSNATTLSPLTAFADDVATNIIKNAIDEVIAPLKSKDKKTEESDKEVQPSSLQTEEKKRNVANDKPETISSGQDHESVFSGAKIERKLVPSIKRSNSMPRELGNVRILTPRSLETALMQHQGGLTRSVSNISQRSASEMRYRLFGSQTTVSTPDFFSKTGLVRQGSMQREIRFGPIRRPKKLQDIPISLQRSFKGVKWWPVEPQTGHVFVKAKKQELISNFKEQLQQIWNWLDLWEDYEKLNLLKEILKLASSEVLSTLYHYIHQRLRDHRDINRLPDKLLLYIFSLLSPDPDIRSCSQVCRRWRYLCAVDSLWMIKCHELGLIEGIENMEQLVLQANTHHMGIDWKLAYQELKRITIQMKYEEEKKVRAAFAEAERLRKKKEAEEGDISPDFISEKSVSIVLDSNDILEQYKKLFHYDEYTPPESEVEIDVKRATQAALEREERLRKEQAAKKRKDKFSMRVRLPPSKEDGQEDGDAVSTVSSENLSERDFIFEAKDEDNEDVDEEELVKTQPEMTWKHLTPREGDKPKELERIQKEQKTDMAKHAKDERDRKIREEQEKLLDIERERFKLHRTKTDVSQVQSKVKQKEPTKKSKDEFAYDVRTDLHQASDILGKSVPSLHLEWKQEDEDVSEYQLAVQKYMGVVKSVRRVRKLEGHMNGVVALWFDKKRLITAGLDRTVRLWDIRSGKSIHKFYGHKGGIRCLQFEGNTLLTGSWDTTIIVWDLRTFEKRAILTDHRGCVSCLYINHDYIFSGSHDCTVRVWYRMSFLPCKVIRGHRGGVNCLAYDGTFLVSGSSDMTLRLVHLKTEECLYVFKNGQDQVLSVVLQGDLIISSDVKGHVYFWNRETGQSEAAIQAHEAPVNKMVFHRGRFFTASGDNTVREWDLLTMTSVRILQGHKAPVRDVKSIAIDTLGNNLTNRNVAKSPSYVQPCVPHGG
ncbi:hypothetical protein FSP39_022386 [Pinctada imbricata]|uniref:F-box domain-containing protein n=1 Tax=Pinctada imbricata TaxID=66713 RepID=A0AA88XXS9_PINIB|nr:hypothetical protein FSP39_022386 [Pinctada imbricata]